MIEPGERYSLFRLFPSKDVAEQYAQDIEQLNLRRVPEFMISKYLGAFPEGDRP